MQLKKYAEFSAAVAAALNAAGVEPVPDVICAVLIVVGTPPNPPSGGSLNYADGKWEAAPAAEVEAVGDDMYAQDVPMN